MDEDEEEMEGTMTLEEISWYIDSLSNYHKIFLHRILAMVRSMNPTQVSPNLFSRYCVDTFLFTLEAS